jgi:hypothetical protein
MKSAETATSAEDVRNEQDRRQLGEVRALRIRPVTGILERYQKIAVSTPGSF